VKGLSVKHDTHRYGGHIRLAPNVDLIICVTGVLGSGALLAASRLSHLWLPLDALSHFTVHLVILLGAFVIGYLMPYERTLAATVVALVGFIGIGAYAHYVSAHPRTISSLQKDERPLRLMTFNTSVINKDIEAISAEVRRLNPDIATLMEFSERKRAVIDRLQDIYPYSAGCVPGRYCHFALLSKVPIIASEVREGWDGPLMVKATLGGEFSGLEIIGVHFPRVPYIKAQFEQLAVLLEYLKKNYSPSVVMGDFNATPFSRLISVFADRTQMRRLTSNPSWPALGELPQFGIDHIFVSRQIRPLEKDRIGRHSGSDHYPVTVTIAVPLRAEGN
jgi:endonuclease/exonuclease/phosphatase (EEP) superfamily protein YafD